MERCPNCRARQDGKTTCRRCGMDLATLVEIERTAERLTRRGVAHMARGDLRAARGDLARAVKLRREPLVELLLGFADPD